MKQRIVIVLAALVSGLLPSLFWAAENSETRSPLNFAPPATDLSVKLLGQIFGRVDGVLAGSGTEILGTMFGVFNAAVLAVGGIVLIYTLVISTINTAQEGQFMGQKWSSVWVPMRAVIGLGLLIPKQSGYCLMQIIIMWIVVQGVGAADRVWESALGYLARGGLIVDYQSKSNPYDDAANDKHLVATDILSRTTCMFALETLLRKARENMRDPQKYYSARGMSDPGPVPDFLSSVNIFAAHTSMDAPKVLFPSITASSPYAKLNGVCGYLEWDKLSEEQVKELIKNASSLTDKNLEVYKNAIKQTSLARAIGVQQMYVGLSNDARKIVTNYLRPDTLTLGRFADETFTVWTSGDNRPALMNGREAINAAINYRNVMLPTLRLTKLPAVDDTKFILQAQREGWILAGSYFFQMIAFSNKATSAPISDMGGVRLGARSTASQACSGLERAEFCELVNNYLDDKSLRDYYQEFNSYLENIPRFKIEGLSIDYKGNSRLNLFDLNLPQVKLRSLDEFRNDLGLGGLGFWGSAISIAPWAIMTIISLTMALLFQHLSSLVKLFVEPFILMQGLMKDVLIKGDPIVQVAKVGKFLIAYAETILAGLLTLLATAPGIVVLLLPVVLILAGILVATGVMFAYYAPVLPFIIFLLGAIGWFAAVIEAMIAGPIIALGVTHPDAQSQAFGKSEPALTILLNIFLRPTVMVIAFICAILLANVSIWILIEGYTRVADALMGMPTIQADDVSAAYKLSRAYPIVYTLMGRGDSPFSVAIGHMMLFGIFLVVYVQIIRRSFDLVYMMPDSILRFIGGQTESYGRQYAEMMRDIDTGAKETQQQIKGGFDQAADAAGKVRDTAVSATKAAAGG